MFGEMTNAIAENTIRTLFHIKVEQKVEREEVAKVTGTNKDDSAVRAPKSARRRRFIQTILAHVEVVRSTNNAVEEKQIS